MATVEVKPLVMLDVIANISLAPSGGDDFSKHLDAVTLTPTASAITWTGLGKNTFSATQTATWSAVLNYAQDWESDADESLSRFLFDNEGVTLYITFRPMRNAGTSWTIEATASPGAIGGTVGSVATASVTLGCTKPVPSV